MENMAVHWSLQSTTGTIAEGGVQDKLDNYPSQVLAPNIWINGVSKLDYVMHWTLEGSVILGLARKPIAFGTIGTTEAGPLEHASSPHSPFTPLYSSFFCPF